jgi:hypothetical protein
MFLSRVLATTLVVGLGIDMGLKAQSFSNADLSIPKLTQTDVTVKNDVIRTVPASKIGSDKLALATSGTEYYVSVTGDDDNDGLTESTAFRTLQKAANKVSNPGDTVYIMNGTYTQETDPNKTSLYIKQKHGSSGAPITFRAYPGHKPVIKSKSGYTVIIADSSYITIQGLTLVGANDDITLEYAQQEKNNTSNPLTMGVGIAITSTYENGIAPEPSHHIVIRHNNISKFGGCGVGTQYADYITIENNTITETSLYSPIGNSPLSILKNLNVDNNTTDYKIILRGNTIYNNINYIPRAVNGKISEGHGIIIDRLSDGSMPAYTGKTLIANNIIYKNGGSGIVVFLSPNVDIVNNTTYQNVQSPALQGTLGEIDAIEADNVKVFNNIMYARKDALVNNTWKATNSIYDNNLVYNSTNYKTSGLSNIIGKDPKFADAANGNFYLHGNSPALETGLSTFNGVSAPDIDWASYNRPLDGDNNGIAIIDLGARERKAD